jgi:hypothetical protein
MFFTDSLYFSTSLLQYLILRNSDYASNSVKSKNTTFDVSSQDPRNEIIKTAIVGLKLLVVKINNYFYFISIALL